MKKKVLCLVLSLLCAATLVPETSRGTEKPIFQAGAAVVDITPTEFPVAINGGFTARYYKEAKDQLNSRAIIVTKGSERFAFVTIDTCLFSDDIPKAIKKIVYEKSGFPVDRISISATHTHFAPALLEKSNIPVDPKYRQQVIDKTAEVILKAIENLQPAKFGWDQERDPRHVFCRRFLMKPGTALTVPFEFTDSKRDLAQMNPGYENPNIVSRTGIPDQMVRVLSFQTLKGEPIAVLANYSTHYAGVCKELSADYFGVFAKEFAKGINAPSPFVAMMTNGTSGDTNCRDFMHKDQPKYDKYVVGNHIAETALKAYARIQYSDDVPFNAVQKEMTLNLRVPTPEQHEKAKEWLAKLEKEKKSPQSMADVYALRVVRDFDGPQTKTFILQAIRIGDIGISTIPNEVFSFTGHDLRANGPFTTNFVIGLANGYNGYLPTTDQFELGGYTTWRGTSYLETTAEPKIRAQLLQMLESLQ